MLVRTVARRLATTLMAVAAVMFVAGTLAASASQHTSVGSSAAEIDCPTGNCSPLPL
jgi:hypothetical protein